MQAEVMLLGAGAALLLLQKLTDDKVLIPAMKSTEYKGSAGQGYNKLNTLAIPPNPLDEVIYKSPNRPTHLEYDRTVMPRKQTTEYIDPVSDTKARSWSPNVVEPTTKGNRIFG